MSNTPNPTSPVQQTTQPAAPTTPAPSVTKGGLGDFLTNNFAQSMETALTQTGVGQYFLRDRVWRSLYDSTGADADQEELPGYVRTMLQRPKVQQMVADQMQQWAVAPENQKYLQQFLQSRLSRELQGVKPARGSFRGWFAERVTPDKVRERVWQAMHNASTNSSGGNFSGGLTDALRRQLARPRMQHLAIQAAQDWMTAEQNQPQVRSLLEQLIRSRMGDS